MMISNDVLVAGGRRARWGLAEWLITLLTHLMDDPLSTGNGWAPPCPAQDPTASRNTHRFWSTTIVNKRRCLCVSEINKKVYPLVMYNASLVCSSPNNLASSGNTLILQQTNSKGESACIRGKQQEDRTVVMPPLPAAQTPHWSLSTAMGKKSLCLCVSETSKSAILW